MNNYYIFYSDGRVIDDTMKSPDELDGSYERAGVQVIVQPSQDERTWVTLCGAHNYIWQYNRWVGVNDRGLTLYLLQAGSRYVLFGETVDNATFANIFARATELCGAKNTFERDEARP